MICLTAMSSCSGDQKQSSSIEGGNFRKLPKVVRQTIAATKDRDAKEFAGLVSYPLQRPYPLKDINTKEEMEAYYNILMDDSISNIISTSKSSQWGEFGWRGWSLDNGEYIWVDEGVYAVPYVSKRETQIMDSLTNVEVQSLPIQLRNGWRPMLTLRNPDTGVIYRIDTRSENKVKDGAHYRLSVYDKDADLSKMPSSIMDGIMTVEGSANVINYIFHNEKGEEYRIFPESMTTGNAVLVIGDGDDIDLQNAYWYDLIKK